MPKRTYYYTNSEQLATLVVPEGYEPPVHIHVPTYDTLRPGKTTLFRLTSSPDNHQEEVDKVREAYAAGWKAHRVTGDTRTLQHAWYEFCNEKGINPFDFR